MRSKLINDYIKENQTRKGEGPRSMKFSLYPDVTCDKISQSFPTFCILQAKKAGWRPGNEAIHGAVHVHVSNRISGFRFPSPSLY